MSVYADDSGGAPGLIQVSSQDELNAALAAATGGETILLAPGDYETLSLHGARFAETVTVSSADPDNPANLTGEVVLRNVENFRLSGVNLDGGGESDKVVTRVRIEQSSHVEISDARLAGSTWRAPEGVDDPLDGWPRDFGMAISDSSDVRIVGLEFTHLVKGVKIGSSDGVVVSDSHFHHMRSDGINFIASSNLLIENNHFNDFFPWLNKGGGTGDHADFIQYWSSKDGSGMDNITIRDNAFVQGDGGQVQSIFGWMKHPAPLTNFTVSGNLIYSSNTAGISLGDISSATIFGNLLIPSGKHANGTTGARPTINLGSGGVDGAPTNVLVDGNVQTLSWNPNFNPTGLSAEENEARGIVYGENSILDQSKLVPAFWASIELPAREGFADQPSWMDAALAAIRAQLPPEVAERLPLDFSFGPDLPTTPETPATAPETEDSAEPSLSDIDFAAGDVVRFFREDMVEIRSLDELVAYAADENLAMEFTEPDAVLLRDADGETIRIEFAAGALPVGTGAAPASATARVGEAAFFDVGVHGVAWSTSGSTVRLEGGVLRYEAGMPEGGVPHGLDTIIFVHTEDGALVRSLIHVAVRTGEATHVADDAGANLSTGHGDDVLIGGAGDDHLYARRGDDWLEGGAGNDILRGREGSDMLIGGEGADRFWFNAGATIDGDRNIVADLDFSEGDALVFCHFEAGAFAEAFGKAGARSARIDSLDMLFALDALSGFDVDRIGEGRALIRYDAANGATGYVDVQMKGETALSFEALWPEL